MDIVQICRALRPGTAWTHTSAGTITDKNGNITPIPEVLVQADDGTPRVAVPTKVEIAAYIAANPDPVPLPDIQSQVIALAQGGQALANLKQALQGKTPTGL